MKKHIVYSLLLLVLVAACKSSGKTEGTDNAQDAAKNRKMIEDTCATVVKAHVIKLSDRSGATVDAFVVTSIDSATEKMAHENFCRLLEDVKIATDKHVQALKTDLEASRKLHSSLVPPVIARLKEAEEKQQKADAEWKRCVEEANAADGTKYKYYKLTITAPRTTLSDRDTLTGPYFVDKDFVVKTY